MISDQAPVRTEIKEMAQRLGVTETRYGWDGARHSGLAKDDSNPYFTFDPNACIVCSRCVRACDEVQGTFALTIEGRGFESRVAASQAESLRGLRVRLLRRVCRSVPDHGPAGEKPHCHRRCPSAAVTTTCAYCGVGCSFKAEVKDERSRAHGAESRRPRESGSCLREGPLRLRLRHARRSRIARR